jgi:hypothetical protein
VTGGLARAAAFFVAPAPSDPVAVATATVPVAARAVVLGAAPDAPPLAAALALALRAAERAPSALVASWGAGDPVVRGAATPAAARLAAALARRELPAVARGRLAWLALPPEPLEAAAAVRRAAALVDGPLVTALVGARPPELEDLVAEHDLAVVAAEPETPLARAALAALSARGIDGRACAPVRRGIPRALAMAGLVAPRLDPAPPAGPRREEA